MSIFVIYENALFTDLSQEVEMAKNSRIFELFSFFHSLSKFAGFIIVNFDDSYIWLSINVLCLLLNLIISLGCTIRSETWCLQMFDSFFSLRKLILFVILQIITFTPLTMLLFYQMINNKLRHIVQQTLNLEEKLENFQVILNIVLVKTFGTLIFAVLILTPSTLTYLSIALTLPFDVIVDSVCMPFYEFWGVVPCVQFINWILLLNYVIKRVQNEIIALKDSNYHEAFISTCSRLKGPRLSSKASYCPNCKLMKCKCKFTMNTIKEVLNIAKELSTAYGIIIFIFLIQYLSRVVTQFYDLIDKDAQRFCAWTNVWNVIIRVISILPVFICCERLKYNVNRTVQLIQQIATLHQPSCLDSIFQSLTLRLQHQNTTIQVCGFLDITYSSFLRIIGTAIAFLVFQLQFVS